MEREVIVKFLHAQININGHIIGAALGSGMTAKYVSMGGADFIMALSAGRYRVMGRSSYASYLCYGNNNDIVMDFGIRELLPIIKNIPILFGILASDPELNLYEYIEEHYMKEIKLRDLALVAHISSTYYSIKFKKDMGITFKEYLINFRMNKARELLKDEDRSCKEVGMAVGYMDYVQFSKIFKKYVGTSPEIYRKQNR